jgi:hypothetical protein
MRPSPATLGTAQCSIHGSGLFVPKATRHADCQGCELPGLGTIVRQRPRTSAGERGDRYSLGYSVVQDLLAWVPVPHRLPQQPTLPLLAAPHTSTMPVSLLPAEVTSRVADLRRLVRTGSDLRSFVSLVPVISRRVAYSCALDVPCGIGGGAYHGWPTSLEVCRRQWRSSQAAPNWSGRLGPSDP